MDSLRRAPEILLIHDGELDDVRALLDRMGSSVEEHCRRPEPPEAGPLRRLVVGTARRMLDPRSCPGTSSGQRPTSIAVLDTDSRTLRANLRRVDVDYVVRRPVHPAALRLLFLYTLYSGPERRREPRASVGVPVRIRAGLRPRRALLTDLSMRGCGLLCEHALEVGSRVIVSLPPDLGVGRTLRMRGRVVRSRADEASSSDARSVAVLFEARPAAVEERLRNAVMIHACGPARLPGDAPSLPRSTPPKPTAPAEAEAVAEPEAEGAPPSVPQRATSTETTGRAEGEDAAADEPPAERRAEPRRDFSRRVIALSEEATKILLGRDLSRGGMRVEGDPDLSLGDRLRLAIPLQPGEAPLVLEAQVTRDDGDRGLALRFADLSDETDIRLKRMLGYLSICRSEADPDADYANLVVSEVLERRGD